LAEDHRALAAMALVDDVEEHRICYQRRKINVSQVFAGPKVGVKQVNDHIWLVTFMHYNLGYFDDETCRLEPIDNPFGPKLLLMSPE
jgi:putative transposase